MQKLNEISKLSDNFYKQLDDAIGKSQFWTKPNTLDDSTVGAQSHTPAAKALQDSLRLFAKNNNLTVNFYVDSPNVYNLTERLTLSKGHPNYPNKWLGQANFVISQSAGRKNLNILLSYLSEDYDMSDLSAAALINHVGSTIRHEFIHKSQILKQQKSRKDKSSLQTFRKMLQDPKQIPDPDDPKYQVPNGEELYNKDYFSAHIEVDAYAYEAAEMLLKKFGKSAALDILRKPINFDDSSLPTALTNYAKDLVGKKVHNELKKKIYAQIIDLSDRGLVNEIREFIRCCIKRSLIFDVNEKNNYKF
jgi:hypothetical protein